MDDLLVELAQQSRPDAAAAPLGMEGEGQDVSVGTGHPGHHGTDEFAGGGEGHHGRLVLVEGLHDVTPAVGGTGGGARQVDEAHHLLDRRRPGHARRGSSTRQAVVIVTSYDADPHRRPPVVDPGARAAHTVGVAHRAGEETDVGQWPRAEIETAFAEYQRRAAESGASGDWRPWADLFTEDAEYIEHLYGRMHGREAIYTWIQETMSSIPAARCRSSRSSGT